MVGIIDYGSGNINAIANIYKRGNFKYLVSKDPEVLRTCSHLFLPGVGAFDETMMLLRRDGLAEAINELVVSEKKPILGICVGMQVLASVGDEGDAWGFGWIPGAVNKLDATKLTHKPLLPHMGWNTVEPTPGASLFKDIDHELGFYFLHSYVVHPESQQSVAAHSTYGERFASALEKDNVFGFQFHPEKSHQNGITVLHNFAKL